MSTTFSQTTQMWSPKVAVSWPFVDLSQLLKILKYLSDFENWQHAPAQLYNLNDSSSEWFDLKLTRYVWNLDLK